MSTEGRYDKESAVAPHLQRSAELRRVYEIRQRRTGELLATISVSEHATIHSARTEDVRGMYWEMRTLGELRAIFMDVSVVEVAPAKAAGAAG